jgi:hypothetical protein
VRPWLPFAAALLLAASATRALAIDTALAPPAVERAVTQGRQYASEHRGFVVAPYLLFGVSDAVQIQDGEQVEAVELATPYEAVRYRAFLSGFERTPLTQAALAAFVAQARTRVDLIAYVHSRSETDREFITAFGAGALTCPDGSTIASTALRSAPVRDVYVNGTTPTYRWRGQIRYRFELNDALLRCDPATFVFSDDRGRVYRVPVDLATQA